MFDGLLVLPVITRTKRCLLNKINLNGIFFKVYFLIKVIKKINKCRIVFLCTGRNIRTFVTSKETNGGE